MYRVFIENEQGFINNFMSALPITNEDYIHFKNKGWCIKEIIQLNLKTTKIHNFEGSENK